MKFGALVALCAAAAFAVASAQSTPVAYPNFPYCQCVKSPSPYSIQQRVTAFGNGTYCFTLNVQTLTSSTGYCATKADVRKMEFNVNPECDAFGVVARATLNGVPTKVGPAIDKATQGPSDARILRITQLNLDQSSDGAMICLTLGKNINGKGCSTLEELCVPPAGSPPGTCSIALFDNKQDCCPISRVNVPTPPPAPPSPPPPPPPPPLTDQCATCAYLRLEINNPAVVTFPIEISDAQCRAFANDVYSNLEKNAAAAGSRLIPNTTTVTCEKDRIKICFQLASNADGQLLNGDALAVEWLNFITLASCPAWLAGYTTTMIVAGPGNDFENPSPSSCLNGRATTVCARQKVDFPKCECDTRPRATRFAALPVLTAEPGRPSNRTNSTLFCFHVTVVEPLNPSSSCGSSNTTLKAEIFGNDIATQRRRILALGIQAADKDRMTFIAPSWGKTGEQTLKATPLNWTPAQADGAKICLELSNTTDLTTFCMSGPNTCWINFFNTDKTCCPLYSATLPL